MSKEEIRKFLSLPNIAKLATTNPDGSPQISPVWFYSERNTISISTYKKAAKVRNIRPNATVSLLIDSSKGGLKLKGVLVRGSANLIEGTECNKIVKSIYNKYLPTRITRTSKATAAFKKRMNRESDSSICIRITPETISTWDYGKLTTRDVKSESAQAYVTNKALRILG
ncbi:MAG: pyridoxamine 5'-phosphate oxidase family protein [Candidatus Bathyarchaeia archaeon]